RATGATWLDTEPDAGDGALPTSACCPVEQEPSARPSTTRSTGTSLRARRIANLRLFSGTEPSAAGRTNCIREVGPSCPRGGATPTSRYAERTACGSILAMIAVGHRDPKGDMSMRGSRTLTMRLVVALIVVTAAGSFDSTAAQTAGA